jgi:hypothetical protein
MANTILKSLSLFRATNPSLERIETLLRLKPSDYIPDHVAFRTFSSNGGINRISRFLAQDYKEMDRYEFPTKKIIAKWFSPRRADLPRVFISELKDESLSPCARQIISESRSKGSLSFTDYDLLRSKSEYGAWTLINGNRMNHAAISLRDIPKIQSLEELHQILENEGYRLLDVGGKIKTSRDGLLKQSSILADSVPIFFSDTTQPVSQGFVEFIDRHREGFEAENALNIFESTSRKH